MADLSIINLDPGLTSDVRYELGPANWRAANGGQWIPNLANPGHLVRLAENQVIDIIILGDGYVTRGSFEARLDAWLKDFFAVDVYDRFAGAFRIRALFRRSTVACSPERDSFYRVAIGASGDDEGEVSKSGWEADGGADNDRFRQRLFESIERFTVNARLYPNDLDVGGAGTVIHNQLARMFSNLVVVMLVRTAAAENTSGRTRAVPDTRNPVLDPPSPLWRTVNVAFGSHALHEFGHAFAYLEDEYIASRGDRATRSNPERGSLFTLSNLTFSTRLERVPWRHLSPWGRQPRQAGGDRPGPVVGWLWRGGEDELRVWHSEYHCLMNGRHENYAYTHDADSDWTDLDAPNVADRRIADLRFRRVERDPPLADIPPRYCLWCHEIVTARILEKTGQLAEDDDPSDIDARGRRWYDHWVETWRARYWVAFDIADEITRREALYAHPHWESDTFVELDDGSGGYKRLDKSDLYQPFTSAAAAPTPAPATEEDVWFAMMWA